MSPIHHRRLVLGVLAGVLVVAVLLVIVVLTVDSPGPASVDDALDRFHQQGGDGTSAEGDRPPEGVYLYEGEGRERLSFPPLTQRDGASMPATVTHQGEDCWAFRIDYNANHWQEWIYCLDGRRILELGGRTGQEWDLGVSTVSNISDFACDPPNRVLPPPEPPGVEGVHSCSGTNSAVEGETTSAGPWDYVGPETLAVGEDEVDTLHFRGERTLTGGQEGDEVTEVWFRSDGLVVRYERDIEARTESPVGAITYTEAGHFLLTSVDPRS